ncbi:AzlC family ABC transporter permease [Aurantimonas sp. Leaf443]|uniref:AzlC family ABC transporter permease n=1 Tax=Aurantimonas sp. Leaf443 TaxID=1736378 RepID=UPI0006FAAE58|nr:AzlC family ABC transporter permease [Aurantimonas sp. Leaf443]KQT86054.1 branched-chain amino acid ABC transporter permease [Aurantimonas sp. Leaf443]
MSTADPSFARDEKRGSEPASEISAAMRDVLPVILAIFPFGLLAGAVSVGAGMSVLEAVGLSASVYAGASQLAAIEMQSHGVPLWSVLVTVFALNFRHVLYSAAVGRHLTRFSGLQKALAFFLLVDPTFGAAESRAARGQITKRYYFVYGLVLYGVWLVTTLVGAVFGSAIENPAAYGIDFILPAYFLALLMTFRHRGGFYPVALASLASSTLVYLLLGPPWHVTIGALGGIAYAALAAPSRPTVERTEGMDV